MRLTYDIIICTYNGEKYISQQILSILRQKIPPVKIIISDDGSSDNTLEVIRKELRNTSYQYQIIKGPRLGIIYNFLLSLKHTSSEYIFLADQDDIWLPNKIETFLNNIKKTPKNNSFPKLFFSDSILFKDNIDIFSKSFFKYQGISSSFLNDDSIIYKNCVQGASCCINKALKDLILSSLDQVNIKNLYMHDWWIALLAKYYGQSYFIDQPTLLYRQHHNNQIGTFNKKWKLFYYFRHLRKFITNFMLAIKQMKELEKFNHVIPSSILKPRSERKYRYVPFLKRCIIYLFRL